jgi:hypothetical protein
MSLVGISVAMVGITEAKLGGALFSVGVPLTTNSDGVLLCELVGAIDDTSDGTVLAGYALGGMLVATACMVGIVEAITNGV